MILIDSKRKDYYDSVKHLFGEDKSGVRFKREFSILNVNHSYKDIHTGKLVAAENEWFIKVIDDLTEYPINSFNIYTKPYGSLEFTFFHVILSGVVYPGLAIYSASNYYGPMDTLGRLSLIFETKNNYYDNIFFFYNTKPAIKKINELIKKDNKDKNRVLEKTNKWFYINDEGVNKEYSKSIYQHMVNNKIPLAAYADDRLVVNPLLKNIGFMAMLDPFTVYQELSTFIDNELRETMELVVPEDKHRIVSHGFDIKKSFRNMPR